MISSNFKYTKLKLKDSSKKSIYQAVQELISESDEAEEFTCDKCNKVVLSRVEIYERNKAVKFLCHTCAKEILNDNNS